MSHSQTHTPDFQTGLDSEKSGPWYRYFMPWFVLCLLLTAVTGSLITVTIAIRNPPALIAKPQAAVVENEPAADNRDERAH